MTTKQTVEKYFAAIPHGGWEAFIADDFTFVNSSFENLAQGRAAYVKAAGRFFRGTTSVEIRRMIAENDQVCVLARYGLRSPKGKTGICDVAEILTVKGDKINSSAIFFDTAALASFMADK